MAGILGLGQDYKRAALSGLTQAANLEENRDQANRTLKAADSAQKKSMAATAGGLGFMAGAGKAGAALGAWGGPVGMVFGAAAGLLLSELI